MSFIWYGALVIKWVRTNIYTNYFFKSEMPKIGGVARWIQAHVANNAVCVPSLGSLVKCSPELPFLVLRTKKKCGLVEPSQCYSQCQVVHANQVLSL